MGLAGFEPEVKPVTIDLAYLALSKLSIHKVIERKMSGSFVPTMLKF
jgi:hypothetical protein